MIKTAVIGATGLVGRTMLEVLAQRAFPVTELIPAASERSAGGKISFQGQEYTIVTPQEALEKRPQIALFSAGSAVSAQWAPQFAAAGCRVIDNSSCWRMDPDKKLVIPEINPDVLEPDDYIIANPNCSTIQMLVAIAGLHRRLGIRRIVVSTYQSITGTGKKALDQMEAERKGEKPEKMAYPYPIDLNLIPQIDGFLENGYTKEEMKMVNETLKIMGDNTIKVSPTAVRVPVTGGHAESLNLEMARPFDMEEVYRILASTPGVVLQERGKGGIDTLPYPMPLYSKGKDAVYVGRIRRDPTVENGLNLWCVADNLRKGAATNAVQIAELLLEKGLV